MQTSKLRVASEACDTSFTMYVSKARCHPESVFECFHLIWQYTPTYSVVDGFALANYLPNKLPSGEVVVDCNNPCETEK